MTGETRTGATLGSKPLYNAPRPGVSLAKFGASKPGKKLSVSIAFASVLALGACDENGEFAFPGANGAGQTAADTAALDGAQSVQLVERDVEAPDAFQVTEAGLWDGRPSLGGVWVAHPDVSEPERVIIRNQTNGTFVIGALFRRERENPGPALQVSSDAAAALEMLAGAPTELQVTALRREEVTEVPQAQPTATFEAPADIAAAPIETATLEGAPLETPVDPIASATAAIEAAETAVASPAPVSAPSAPSPTSSLDKPYIQLGIFSVEANATSTADRMRASGIVPTVLEQSSQGRTFWRVIVGPATSTSERADILAQVKSQGFDDAYFVTN